MKNKGISFAEDVVFGCSEKIYDQLPCTRLRRYIQEQLVDPVWIDVNHLVCNQIKLEVVDGIS